MAALTLDRVLQLNGTKNAKQITRIQLNNSDIDSIDNLRFVT